MSDLSIRTEGRAGRITLTREAALNALSYDMCLAIEAALDRWRDDTSVALVILDAAGPRAFCAGGDIAQMYHTGRAGEYDYARRFWRDEYRLNAKLAAYPKPVVSFMQGFTMGGGVGLGGHVSHRVVGETAKIAMPEVSIGFIPDVGGTYLLARAPGHLGEYLGLTAHRMTAADAIHAGFADHYIPEDQWPSVKDRLAETGDIAPLQNAQQTPPVSALAAQQERIDAVFGAADIAQILSQLGDSDWDNTTRETLQRMSPLSLEMTLRLVRELRGPDMTMPRALQAEYRISHRIMERGDFLEGIRAAIIDKDKSPKWQHAHGQVPPDEVAQIMAPLGNDEWTFTEGQT
ncbi:enoyl-CoA hydratase/isomerase family protein [Sagittula sp. SSi028]|uniref:enoyl-CoA hydratase/isomerase family protein n=1 Tax=Sagittula sp. SSi028 TaxID=3400636 RepID=UPI003AF811CA